MYKTILTDPKTGHVYTPDGTLFRQAIGENYLNRQFPTLERAQKFARGVVRRYPYLECVVFDEAGKEPVAIPACYDSICLLNHTHQFVFGSKRFECGMDSVQRGGFFSLDMAGNHKTSLGRFMQSLFGKLSYLL
jgi:hypothetical protein